MSKEAGKPVVVADQKVADAFKQLGIDAIVKGASTEPTEEVTLLKGQIDTLNAEIEELKKGDKGGAGIGSADSLSKIDFEKSITSLGTIQKAVLDTLSNMSTQVDEFVKSTNEKLEEIENQVEIIGTESKPRGSITNTRQIKKAFELDEKSGLKQLSKSNHAKQIIDLLDSLSQEGDNKEMYEDATTRYEMAREITKAVISDLKMTHSIEIID